MDKKAITGKIEEAVARRGCFLVDVTVSKGNEIVLAIREGFRLSRSE